MATASTALSSMVNVQRPNPFRICLKETKYEFLKSLRFPMYSVSTIVFPLMFYILFGLVMGRQMIGGVSTTVYLIPAYGTFGVMGASLFGTAASLASERGLGWLQVKRASPMPPFAYFLAKVIMSLMFSTANVLLLLSLGIAFGGVHLPAMTAAKLVATLVAGSLPFCAMGLAIGYFAGPTSAPAVINMFHLPMAFCSGLWIPFMFLPKLVQHIAVFLPPYHLSQLALSVVGAGSGAPNLGHWEALGGFAMICLGVARWGHQRDQKANG
jgi:ABC-2 type transport system permease protein